MIDTLLLDGQSAFERGLGRGLGDCCIHAALGYVTNAGNSAGHTMAFVDLRRTMTHQQRHRFGKCCSNSTVSTHSLCSCSFTCMLAHKPLPSLAARRLIGLRSVVVSLQGLVLWPLRCFHGQASMVRQALSTKPEDCGLQVAYRADGELFIKQGRKPPTLHCTRQMRIRSTSHLC
jgi:hypothetical protein